MKTLTLRYPLPCPPPPEAWRFIYGLLARRGLPPPSTRLYAGRWRLDLPAGEYVEALAYLQNLSVSLGLPAYHPEAPTS